MRTAVIGGSFNPPHIGHLLLADEVRHSGYERVLFIPSFVSAHKQGVSRPSPDHRLRMTELAAEAAGAETDDCEIRRGGVSYTIDTVEDLLQRFDVTGKLGIVIGDDLLAGFYKWKQAAHLAETVDIVVAKRMGNSDSDFGYPHVRLDNFVLPVSSTHVRELIQQKRAYKFLVPESVFQYIEENKLYSGNT